MSNERKIFGAILALAASAFGVDHWWLNPGQTPAQAPASLSRLVEHAPASRKASNASANGPVPGRSDKSAPAGRTLAARLLEAARNAQLAPDASDGSAEVPDAFMPSTLWYPAPSLPVGAAPPPVIPPERIAEFRGRHTLTAVMKSARTAESGKAGGLAIIGGKVYSPGQVIDGFTLVSIGERTALLICNGVSIELTIDRPGALTSLSGGE